MTDQLLVFSIILFSVFIVPLISSKTKIPTIVFYILSGLVFEHYIFKSNSVIGDIHIFSEIGKLYLMFIAGVEINLFLFKRNVSKSAVFGVLSFLIPQVLGTLIFIQIFGYTTTTAILTASLFASHTLLSLVIINKFGIENSEPISIAVGATIISDIAVLALLAIIADIHNDVNATTINWLLMFLSWGALIAATLLILPKIAAKVFKKFSEDGYAQFLFVLASACLVAWAAHHLRMESLIGAFFCGLAFCKLIPNQSVLMNKINFVGNTLFIPFFMITAGMLMKSPQKLIEQPDALILGVILTILTIITKSAASFIFGRIFKFSKEAILMTAGMTIQQAATTIVCAVVGFEIGVINETIFNAAMILILLTCTIGEILSVHFAREYAQTLSKKVDWTTPSESKTLVVIPNVASCHNLLDFAGIFRAAAKKYLILPLAVAEDEVKSIAEAETILGYCMNYANELGGVYQPEMRIANNVIDGIMRAAVETRANMLIVPFEYHCFSLIDECGQRIVFAKIKRNITQNKRILVVFMPTSEIHSDLLLLIAEIKHLSQQTHAEIVFYMSECQKEKLYAQINKFLPKMVKYKIIVKAHWNMLKSNLPDEIRLNDTLIIAMGVRQKFFRSPVADRFPLHLAEHFPHNNVFSVYSPYSLVENEGAEASLDEKIQDCSPENPNMEAIQTKTPDFAEIISEISIKSGIEKAEIYDFLLSSLQLYPVELAVGVLLIHAHIENIACPQAYLWFQKENQEIIPTKFTPNVLAVVLNPRNSDPQIHLKTLSRIAGLFSNPQSHDAIENAENSNDLLNKLLNL